MNILAHSGLPYSVLHKIKNGKFYTGKFLMSLLIPRELNFSTPKGGNGGVKIVRGQIQEPGGQFTKNAFGAVANGLLHHAWYEFAQQGTTDLLDSYNHTMAAYIRRIGFTVGSKDVDVPEQAEFKISRAIATRLLEVNHLITEAESNPVLQEVAVLEPIIQGELDAVRETVGKTAVASLGDDNNFNIMGAAESKGSLNNTAQMTACVGQQAVEGRRVMKKVNGRTLPHFYQNDDSGPARGFISNNYTTGLAPHEFIFHTMAGREGLIDTAIKTAETGYIQRRLEKAMEDLMVFYDNTVRTAGGTLLQPLYGYNGVDPIFQAQLEIGIITADNDKLRKVYCLTADECKSHGMSSQEASEYYKMLRELRDTVRYIRMVTSSNPMILETRLCSPINFSQIITKFRNMEEDYPNETPLNARYIMSRITGMLSHESTPMMRISKRDLETPGCVKLRDEELAKTFLRVIIYEFLSPKRVLHEYKFGRERFDLMLEEALMRFQQSAVAPGEMVGSIGAQSVGEPCTQMVLTSVDWHEKVVIRMANGDRKVVKIGQWIDDRVEDKSAKKRVKDMGNEQAYLDTNDEGMDIMSIDEDGNTSWKRIEAITRHLPVNEDGSRTLLKVKTYMGREIIATKAKSFLVADGHKILPLEGSKLKVGMRIPLVHSAPITDKEVRSHLDMSQYFPKTEYIWGSDATIARRIRDDGQAENSKYPWFNLHNGREFTLPYSRSDSAGVMIDGGKDGSSEAVQHGMIYMKYGRHIGEFPEQMPLDRKFGFLVGAYLAEGCVTKTYVAISNNDAGYRSRVREFCQGLNIGTHDQVQHDKNGPGWTSSDIRIHSCLFAKFLGDTCGRGSAHKRVPDWAHNAPDEFIKGLLDGYYSGDGSVYEKRGAAVNCSSISKELIIGIQQLLFRYNIMGRISTIKGSIRKGFGTGPKCDCYVLSIRNQHARAFAHRVTLQLEAKQERLNKIKGRIGRAAYCKFDMVPDNGTFIKRTDLEKRFMDDGPVYQDSKQDVNTLCSPVYYDPVVSIEEVEPSKKYVYDFTIADTRTFVMYDGFAAYDTFHSAGQASKGAGNLGVPRMRELLSFSKNPKTPRMTIQLQKQYEERVDIAQKVASSIRYTIMKHVTSYVEVYYEPDPMIKGGWMELDNASNIFTGGKCQNDVSGLPWLMRIVLSRDGMLDTGVQLLDIKAKFCEFWSNRTKESKKLKKKEEKIALDKVTRVAILSNYSTSQDLIIHIRYETTAVNNSSHMALCDVIQQRMELKGIAGLNGSVDVVDTAYKAFDESGAIVEKKRYSIITEGVNLLELRYFNYIDMQATSTNNVVDIYMVMGIEAARASLKKEYRTVIAGAGTDADYRHLCLLADLSTNSGDLVPIDRHGMTKLDAEFLAKATNETTVEQLLNSAFYGDVDYMNNVSSRIMAGMAFNGGTNSAKIFMDFDKIQRTEYLPEHITSTRKFVALTENQAIDDILKQALKE